jgi:glycosyltransferase involved in cell wall biosynthesis
MTGAAAAPVGAGISLLLGSLELGGAERIALGIARHLRQRGRLTMIHGMGLPGRLCGMLDAEQLPWESVPRVESRFAMRSRWRMHAVGHRIAMHRPRVVIGFTHPANVTCGLVARRLGAAAMWFQLDEGLSRCAAGLERSAVAGTDAFVANSPGGAAFLQRQYGIPVATVGLIPTGVELPAPQLDRHAWRRRLGTDGSALIACMVANLSRRKDHATLLRAWAAALATRTSLPRRPLLVLAGRFDDAHAGIEMLIRDLGLAGSVVLAGEVSDIAGLLGACDLALFSSLSEGCPNGVLEAMAAGLPVAASDIPGIRHAFGGGLATDLLAPSGDAGALAWAIGRLLDDARLREERGLANREHVQRRFTGTAMNHAMDAVLRRWIAVDP